MAAGLQAGVSQHKWHTTRGEMLRNATNRQGLAVLDDRRVTQRMMVVEVANLFISCGSAFG
jgi:hypothetical protein